MPFENVLSVTLDDFIETICFDIEVKTTTPLFTVTNDIDNIIQSAFTAVKKYRKHKIYLLTHPFFPGKLGPGEYVPIKWEEMFSDFCNFFDKHRFTMTSMIKLQFTDLSSKEHMELPGLPRNQKIILIVENFNLWDKNSQLSLAKFPESNNDVQILAQIRSDFEPGLRHIDLAATNRGRWVQIETV